MAEVLVDGWNGQPVAPRYQSTAATKASVSGTMTRWLGRACIDRPAANLSGSITGIWSIFSIRGVLADGMAVLSLTCILPCFQFGNGQPRQCIDEGGQGKRRFLWKPLSASVARDTQLWARCRGVH